MRTTMVNTGKAAMLVAAVSISATSCREDTKEMSTDEVADAIQFAVSEQSNGLAAGTTDALTALTVAGKAVEATSCNILYDSTVTRNGVIASITYNYTFGWSYRLNCNNFDLPQSFEFDYSGQGTYDTPRMSSADEATADLLVTGLQLTSTEYVFNGSYGRSGSQTSKVGQQNSFTSTITFTLADVTVSPVTQQITGGSANMTIAGAVTDGESFSYTGSIVFNGNGTADLTIDGETITFEL